MTLPARRPQLMAQRREKQFRAEQRLVAAERDRDESARNMQRSERERSHRHGTDRRGARVTETAGGWSLSIFGALITSLLLTWLLRHPEILNVMVRGLGSLLRNGSCSG